MKKQEEEDNLVVIKTNKCSIFQSIYTYAVPNIHLKFLKIRLRMTLDCNLNIKTIASIPLVLYKGTEQITIGRYPSSEPSIQIQAFNTKVSKDHAIVTMSESSMKITCLSRNGLFINNNFVDYEETCLLKWSDKVFIGNTVYHLECSDVFEQSQLVKSTLVTSDDRLLSEMHKMVKEPSSEIVDVESLSDKENSMVAKVVKKVKFVDSFMTDENIELPSSTPCPVADKVPDNLEDLVIEAIALSGHSHLNVNKINEVIDNKHAFGNLKSTIRSILNEQECFECRTDSGVTSKMWTYLPAFDRNMERGELYSHCMSQLPSRRSKQGVKRYYFKPVYLANEKKQKKCADGDYESE